MARQAINIGSSANDGTGDPLRTAFDKINDNFIELYGTDNDINTLDANLDVNNFAITTGVTNGNITVTPNGTGNINLGSITVNGSQISSNDSTQITLADNIQTTGTINVTGAATLATSLTLASGATVTGILDEDNMATNSATQLATQQSIKAYVDTQLTAEDLDFQADSGGALSIDLDSETMTFTGGTGIDTSGSGNTITFAIDSTVATLTGSQTLTNKTLTSPTINGATMTGTVTVDTISMADNTITTGASNANLELDASGSGIVRIIPNTTVVGTLTTADISTTGTQTITGTLNVDGVQVKDNKVTTNATNANLELSANGSGVVDVQDAMTTVGQTITGNVVIDGQFDVDNISINGNGIIATNSNGGININPNGTGSVTIGGSNVSVPSTLTTSTLFAETQILLGDGAKIVAANTNADIHLETLGTGSVILDQVSITDNAITTHVSNADLKIGTDGTGSIDLTTGNITRTGDLDFNVSGNILLDADGGTVFLQDNGTSYAQLLRSGSNDLTIASGSTQALIFTGANAAFQGDVSATGNISNEAIRFRDNIIEGTRSDEDIKISPSGSGDIVLGNLRIGLSTGPQAGISSEDSSSVQFKEGISVNGQIQASAGMNISGDITHNNGGAGGGAPPTLTTGKIVGTAVTIDDNNISATRTNDDLSLSPSGTGTVDLKVPTQSTVGAVGAATHLPLDSANEIRPALYIKVKVSGVEYVIPAFNAS